MRTPFGRYLLSATAGVGLAAVSLLNAHAADPYHLSPHPAPVAPNCPYPILPAPGAPLTAPTPAPAPGATTPRPTPTPTDPGAATPPTDPGAAAQTPTDPGAGATIPADAMGGAGADAGAAAAADGGESGLTSGTGTDMIGRSDFFNRFNLFDTQSAVPRTRAWFAFQRNEGFNPAAFRNPTGPFNAEVAGAVAQRPTQYLYRGGFELALTPCLSIAAQHQYIGVADAGVYDPSWGDPQFLVKYALSMECDRVVSATLGFSPHFSMSPGEIRSPRARIYPGLLYWRNLSEVLFSQAGVQAGIPLAMRGDIVTIDYAVSTGFWAYKAPDCGSCRRPWVTAVAPQVEVFGQHAFWDNAVSNPPTTGAGTVAVQGRHVLDLTLGTSVFVRDHILFAGGYSFPITGAEARRGEVIATVQFRF